MAVIEQQIALNSHSLPDLECDSLRHFYDHARSFGGIECHSRADQKSSLRTEQKANTKRKMKKDVKQRRQKISLFPRQSTLLSPARRGFLSLSPRLIARRSFNHLRAWPCRFAETQHSSPRVPD